MKKLLLSLLCMAAVAFGSNAQTTVAATSLTNVPGATTVSGFTFDVDKGDGATAPTVHSSGALRAYANNTITISGTKLTKIVFNLNSTGSKRLTDLTPSAGKITTTGITSETTAYTWEGDAASVTFTVGATATYGTDGTTKAGQVHIDSFDITGEAGEGGDTPVTPGVSIANTAETAYTVTKALEILAAGQDLNTEVYIKGEIKSISEVSTQYGNATYVITDGTSDLTIYRGYYLNGDKFTAEDQIKVGQNVVLLGKLTTYNTAAQVNTGSKLISIDGQGDTPVETVTVATLAEALAQAVNTPVKYTGTATVIWQHQSSLYVKDATATALVYGALTQAYTSGTQIAGFEAKVSEYQGVKQLVPVADTFAAGTAGTAVAPDVMTIEEVASDLANSYVKFENVTIAAGENARTFTMTDATGSITLYQNWTDIAIKTGTDMTVVGFIGLHSGNVQILAAEVTGEGGSVTPPVDPDGNTATFNFADPSTLTPAYSLADAEDDGTTGNKKIDFAPSNFTANGIVLSTEASGNPSRLYYQTKNEAWSYRIYKNSVTTITCPDGFTLLSVAFDTQTAAYATALGNCTFSEGTYADKVLTITKDNVTSVTITNPSDGGAAIGFNGITVTFKNLSGISDVELEENAPVEYYNLQGVRVAGDLTPGLYIRRQGNTATKVLVK